MNNFARVHFAEASYQLTCSRRAMLRDRSTAIQKKSSTTTTAVPAQAHWHSRTGLQAHAVHGDRSHGSMCLVRRDGVSLRHVIRQPEQPAQPVRGADGQLAQARGRPAASDKERAKGTSTVTFGSRADTRRDTLPPCAASEKRRCCASGAGLYIILREVYIDLVTDSIAIGRVVRPHCKAHCTALSHRCMPSKRAR
jgi:hypothetical protein